MNNIHNTAIIGDSVRLGDGVCIGAYAIVEPDVEIGNNTVIEPHAKVCSGARIGANCRICSFANVSGLPQDLHFDASLKTYAQIGDGTVVRECASVHRATFEGKSTVVGKNCLIMTSGHIGHDCVVGDNVIIANYAALAGHVHCGGFAFMSGGVMIHQRTRIGEGVIVSGNSAASMDIPPFVIAEDRNNLGGLNLIGMTRRGMSRAEISEIKSAYFKVYGGGAVRKNALELLESGTVKFDGTRRFLEFFKMPERRYLFPRKSRR